MASKTLSTHERGNRLARRAVQLGFLLLFLYPLAPILYQRLTSAAVPGFTSWLLPFDPLLALGSALRGRWAVLVIGAPLTLLALSFVLGRSFCGWVCPVGSLLDLIRPLAFWQRRARVRTRGNSAARYILLAAVLLGSLVSLQVLGLFDPLVIFHRAATSLTGNLLLIGQPALRVYLSLVSLVLLAIVALELWQPRFWCRNLCPLGALLSLVSRFSLLNRRVSDACTRCGECRRTCPMNAIPGEPHDTDYSDCTFCLECEARCPKQGVSFGFGALAGRRWQRTNPEEKGLAGLAGNYVPAAAAPKISRRQFLTGLAAGGAALVITPLASRAAKAAPVKALRPPGALPEDEFVRTCILCQECVRVCPTGGLRPATLEAGLAGIGTPILLPRQGGCSLNPSCPHLCASVCPVGAIQPIQPAQMKVGLARVDRSLCLAWDQGVRCLVCVEACLNNAAQPFNGRITVDPTKCTGCGRCESGCPVAGSAIRVYPVG